MSVRKVKKCALEYTVPERAMICGDDVACLSCGWNADEAERRKRDLVLKLGEDGLWRMYERGE